MKYPQENLSLTTIIESYLFQYLKKLEDVNDINNHINLSLSHQQLLGEISNHHSDKNNQFYLSLIKGNNYITYKSHICLKLTNYHHQKAILLADLMANYFNYLDNFNRFQITSNSKGWLIILPRDNLVNQWLTYQGKITEKNIPILRDNKIKLQKINFTDYYVYSRCCSILTSAHEQNLIRLNDIEFTLNQWYIKSPLISYKPILANSHYEYQLMETILIIINKIEQDKLSISNDLATLKNSLLNVERHCRIWGKVLRYNPDKSKAILGLIAIGLQYYQQLFYTYFSTDLLRII